MFRPWENARQKQRHICLAFEDENMRLENQKKAEKLLAEKVADNINHLLADERLQLDVSTSKHLFDLLGGGIRINEEYIPVESRKIGLAINGIKKEGLR